MTKALVLALSVSLLGACSSDAKKRQRADQNLQSWEATVRAVGEQWLQGHTPQGYSEATLARAQQAVQKELDALPPGGETDALRNRGRQIQSRAEKLGSAIQHADRAGAQAVLER